MPPDEENGLSIATGLGGLLQNRHRMATTREAEDAELRAAEEREEKLFQDARAEALDAWKVPRDAQLKQHEEEAASRLASLRAKQAEDLVRVAIDCSHAVLHHRFQFRFLTDLQNSEENAIVPTRK